MKVTDGAKIFVKNDSLNKYLFILRDNNPNIPNSNMWGLLGGGIEPGEIPLNTVIRELKEEISIDVYDIKQIFSRKVVHSVKGKKYEVTGHYFIGKTNIVDLSSIILNEGQSAAFFSLQEISEKSNVAPVIKELIATCKEDLK